MSSARPDTWMPLYIGDYLADTMHLSAEQHGVYLLLIMALWRRNGALPNDEDQLAAIARVPKARWRALLPLISPFFEIGSEWRQHRVTEELQAAERMVERGRTGGLASAQQRAIDRARREQPEINETGTLLPSPSPSPSQERTNTRRAGRASLSPEDLDEFQKWYDEYPRHEDRGHAESAFLKARKTASLEQLTSGARRYAQDTADREKRFIALPATWLNGKRWLDGETSTKSTLNGTGELPVRRTPTGPPPAVPDDGAEQLQ